MLQAQGLQLDPYKTLRLHPHAPRELIVDAYWILVSRDRANPAHGAIDALNASYSLLVNDAERAAYDLEHGLQDLPRPTARLARTGLGRLGIGGHARVVARHADYYHVLCVDAEADGEIIGAARRVMLALAGRSAAEPALMRELVDEAYRTLGNPQLRAQYDAQRDAATRPADAAPSVPAATAPPTPHATSPTMEDAPGGATPSAPAASAAPSARAASATPSAPAASTMPSAAAASEAPSAPAASVLPSAPATSATPPIPAELLKTRKDSSHDDEPDVDERSAPPDAGHERRRGFLPLFYRRQPATGDTAPAGDEPTDAVHTRLLTLRDAATGDARNGAQATRVVSRPAEPVLGQLAFISGPRAGERVLLGARTVTLGADEHADVVLGGDGVAPEHARIWLHGEHVVLWQVGDAGMRVGGQPLRMPMVLLDDGDEIEIGTHRLRFSSSVE